MKDFLTIKDKIFRHEFVVEKSRFISFACQVSTVGQANFFIESISKQHYDATHNCYAYLTDEGQKFSDDGEPQGTAGMPILEVLKNKKLYETAVAVVRYFGGIKLGAGGLVRAYTNSVAEAVKATGIAEKVLVSKFSFMYDLNEVGKILNILYQQQLFEIADVEYGLKAKVILKMKDSDKESAEAWLTESLNKTIVLEREGSEFIEVPLAR